MKHLITRVLILTLVGLLALPTQATAIPVIAQGGCGTALASVASDGIQGNNFSGFPEISANGRYIAFTSAATNLVPGDTNPAGDVFVHDMQTGRTTRISVASDGAQANNSSWAPAISADGRYVAFESNATNLVSSAAGAAISSSVSAPADAPPPPIPVQVFVHDMQTGDTTLASVASDGTTSNGGGYGGDGGVSISADGRYVVFASDATNLVPQLTNGSQQVFLHDTRTGQTSLVSAASDGTPGNGSSGIGPTRVSISGDGRYATFASWATNLVPADTNAISDVFVHDMQTGQTARISVASDGTQGDGYSSDPRISADGRYVAFGSASTNFAPGGAAGNGHVFVHDMRTGWTTVASITCSGTQGNGASAYHSISAEGRFVAFQSSSTDMVLEDTNAKDDVFVRDRGTGSLYLPLVIQAASPGW